MTQVENFGREQAKNASAWILRGDWTRKGVSGTLELADFFPTTEQLESVKTQSMRLMTEEEIRRLCEAHREYGRQDEREYHAHLYAERAKAAKEPPQMFEPGFYEKENEALRMLMRRLRHEHAALVACPFPGGISFEEWYDGVNDKIVEIAKNPVIRAKFLKILLCDEVGISI